MRAKDTVRCTNCRRLQARVDALEAELAALKQVVAQLGQQLAAARKDSSTSSKPPSSDIVKPHKPPPPQGQDKRRIGGQPGHPKHERVAFPRDGARVRRCRMPSATCRLRQVAVLVATGRHLRRHWPRRPRLTARWRPHRRRRRCRRRH